MGAIVLAGARFLDSQNWAFLPIPFPGMVHLKQLNTFVKTHEKYFHDCCPLVQHEFLFCGQSFFFNYESSWAGSIQFHHENSWKTWLFGSSRSGKQLLCKKKKWGGGERKRNGGWGEKRRMTNLVHIFHYGYGQMLLMRSCTLFATGFCSMGVRGSLEDQKHRLLLRSKKDTQSNKLFQELKNIQYHLQKQI